MQRQILANKTTSGQLPTLIDSKYIRDEVTRLIRNKIEPLAFKHYVLKSGRCITKQQNANLSLNLHKLQSQANKENINVKERQKRNRKTQHKQNPRHQQCSPGPKTRRRKAMVQIPTCFDRGHYKLLQSKVQNHIMLKKMNMMEGQYTNAEQCNKKQRQAICQKLRTSPMQKYLQLFEQSQRPSQKIQRVKQASCQQMLKQIKSAKSIKHIECIQENMGNLINSDNKARSLKQKKKQGEMNAINNKKLKKQIMTDIKRQYQNQGSAKIRISINHKKMIQIM